VAVSKPIELAGQPSPLYCGENKYQLVIERMVKGFRRTDAPTVPQLAVPVTVAKRAFTEVIHAKDPFQKHVGLLIMVAFYFLLRVGEYTQPRYVQQNGKRVLATRTKQFTVGNVGFYKNGRVVSRSSALKTLLTCDIALLKITNQKNGRMG